MGRGRAKAKQTKVARDLKYSTGTLDPLALQRELGSTGAPRPTAVRTGPTAVDEDEPDYTDPYADQFADDDEDDTPQAAAR